MAEQTPSLSVLNEQAQALLPALAAMDAKNLNDARVAWLGRNGQLTQAAKAVGKLTKEDRPAAGQALNALKNQLEEAFDARQKTLAHDTLLARTLGPPADVSEPGFFRRTGSRHPLRQLWEEIEDIFTNLGFAVEDGPEVESDYYNFEALNIPADHPARDDHDTLFVGPGRLLRTHTSNVQIHVMKRQRPPIQVISLGRTYRRDEVTPRHSPMFHQLEVLHIDQHLHMGHLKGMLQAFIDALFGPGLKIRLRPSFFPFTEPSAEVDVSCLFCHGQGCRVCSGTGWMEILGSGLVDPRVLREAGINPDEYSGYAFGAGLERIAMLRHHIHDIRLFTENDLAFLRQF